MEQILEMKMKCKKLYGEYSKYIDKLVLFFVALAGFYTVNEQLGFMKLFTNPAVMIGLAAVCAFLSSGFIVVTAAILMLGHIYSVSLGMLAVTVLMLVVMYAFYVRMAPKTGIVLVLIPIAYMFKVPVVIPVAVALLGNLAYAIPVALGTVIYYLMQIVGDVGEKIKSSGESGLFSDMTVLLNAFMQNKQMWVLAIAGAVCTLAVYLIRKSAVPHAWKIASVVGTAVYCGIAVSVAGVSASSVAPGAIAAIVTGLIMEVAFFCVDYLRTETMQFEDDDYVYYLKAVPKVKSEAEDKTEPVLKRTVEPKKKEESKVEDKTRALNQEETEKVLLTRSLERDLNIDLEGKY